jgi:uncharacterized protein
VVIGGKDAQVDAEVDGQRLQHASAGHANVTIALPPDANHVLKEDPRSIAEVAASGNARHSDPETHLEVIRAASPGRSRPAAN